MQEQNDIYTVLNPESRKGLILTCEHASARIPEEYHNLGLTATQLDTHIARDKGCRELTTALAAATGCTAFIAGYSRLFIDYNRRENEDSLVLDESDKIFIPGNHGLSAQERQQRIEKYHRPYYRAIAAKIKELQKQCITPQIFSIHSFTPQLRGGSFRPWNAGVLYVKNNPLAEKLLSGLQKIEGLNVAANVPYDMRLYNTGAAAICGEDNGLENVVIEIRDTEFQNMEASVPIWTQRLKNILIP